MVQMGLCTTGKPEAVNQNWQCEKLILRHSLLFILQTKYGFVGDLADEEGKFGVTNEK